MANKSEEKCKDKLKQYLDVLNIKHTWEDLSCENADPPDYYLKVDSNNRKIAVEITETEVIEEPTLNSMGDCIIKKTYHTSHINILKGIENEARAREILNGMYVVSFRKPISGIPFKQNKDEFKKLIMDYIEKTTSFMEYQKQEITISSKKVCNVEKHKSPTNCIEAIFSEFSWTYSEENIERLSNIIQVCIDRKIKKLQNIKESKILIIDNTYLPTDSCIYQKCMRRLKHVDFFEYIFMVVSGLDLLLIYKKEKVSFI